MMIIIGNATVCPIRRPRRTFIIMTTGWRDHGGAYAVREVDPDYFEWMEPDTATSD